MFSELAHLRVGPDVIHDLEEKHGTRMRRIKRLITDEQALETAKARRLQEHRQAREDAELAARELAERYQEKRRSLEEDPETSDTEVSEEPFRILLPKDALEPLRQNPEQEDATRHDAVSDASSDAPRHHSPRPPLTPRDGDAPRDGPRTPRDGPRASRSPRALRSPRGAQRNTRDAQRRARDAPHDAPRDAGDRHNKTYETQKIHNAQNMDAAAWQRWKQWKRLNRSKDGNPHRRKELAHPLCHYFCRNGTCGYKKIYGKECMLVHPSADVLEAARRDVLTGAGDVALAALNIMTQRGLLRR